MKVFVLHVVDCPNVSVALERTRTAAAALGLEVILEEILVEDESAAAQLGFAGSPTILIDGDDRFAEGTADPSLACRLYRTPEGLQGSPSVAALSAALTDAATTSPTAPTGAP